MDTGRSLTWCQALIHQLTCLTSIFQAQKVKRPMGLLRRYLPIAATKSGLRKISREERSVLSETTKRFSFLRCNNSADVRIESVFLIFFHLELAKSQVHLSVTLAATNNKHENEGKGCKKRRLSVGFRDLELAGGWCIKEIAISMVHAAWTQSMESIIFD